MQECGQIIACSRSYRFFWFSLSFSQAEAKENEKAKEEARRRRESGKAPSYAVSGIHPTTPTWPYNLNIFQSLEGTILPSKKSQEILTLFSRDDIEMNTMGT